MNAEEHQTPRMSQAHSNLTWLRSLLLERVA